MRQREESRQENGELAHSAGARFGPFVFFVEGLTLLRDGERLPIGSRAAALLGALCAEPGRYVPNEELKKAAWPTTIVEDANLRVQMTALRRVLDSGRGGLSLIQNAPGRGYALVVDVETRASSPLSAESVASIPRGLPTPLTTLVGREDSVALVKERLATRRLVSIVGPGGIGKTRVAIEASWQLARERGGPVCFVDFSPLTSGAFALNAVGATVQLDGEKADTRIEDLINALNLSPMLLVLDNCEHVLDAVADIVETLMRSVPSLQILTTSREPFLVEGEVVVRLTGLDVPAAPETLSLEEALDYPAVQLFLQRATESADDLQIRPDDISALAEICGRLDGIPLAIELVAPRVTTLGLVELARHLADQIGFAGESRRSATPRHRTLRATIEWSFAALETPEQQLFARLGVFRYTFTMDAARSVCGDAPQAVVQRLSNLVAKSLVVVEHVQGQVHYRLLETTRVFAAEKLDELPDQAEVRQRHAEYLLGGFRSGRRPAEDSRRQVDDVRAAINWCLGEGRKPELGVQLIVESAPMWLRVSALAEYAALIENAADRLWQDPSIDPTQLMWLAPSLHNAHYNSVGLSPKIESMLLRALEIAEAHKDHACQLNCLWPLFGTRLTQARYAEALEFAERFAALTPVSNDAVQKAMGHRIVSLSLWRNGELRQARTHAETALSAADTSAPSPVNLTLIYKQGVTARANFSNLLWLTGRTDAAQELAEDAIAAGLRNDVVGLCYALAQTIIPLSFWLGNLERVRSQTALLQKLSRESDLGAWLFWGRCYEHALLQIEGGGCIDDTLRATSGLQRDILGTILDRLNDASSFIIPPPRNWAAPEFLRRQAKQLWLEGAFDGAERGLRQAVADAGEQGGFAWELRAATTLARLLLDRGQPHAARDGLEPVIERITEGSGTRDVERAQRVFATVEAVC